MPNFKMRFRMPYRFLDPALYATLMFAAVWTLAPVAIPQSADAPTQSKAKPAAHPAPAPKRDLTGVWQYQGSGGSESLADEKDMPPMTPWAQTRFDAEKPGYGSRATPGGNDPILQCDPTGFPRVMYSPTPFEFVPAKGRLLQFWEREHAWRPIWTDGRSLPTDADPTWFGYAIGHWEGDYTFVVESAGFNDRTWLGPNGYPHSEDMRVTERYHRVDYDTILYDITVTDPKAYTRPIIGAQHTMKLKPKEEIDELVCVWSDEDSFARRVRQPAAKTK
jgi:hypothetical protein